jgi:hypothetical protein
MAGKPKHKFTKSEQEFIDYLDAVVQAELDLEYSINVDGKFVGKDFEETIKIRREFFKWFRKLTNPST